MSAPRKSSARADVMYRDENGKIRRRDGWVLICHQPSKVAHGWEMPYWRWSRP